MDIMDKIDGVLNEATSIMEVEKAVKAMGIKMHSTASVRADLGGGTEIVTRNKEISGEQMTKLAKLGAFRIGITDKGNYLTIRFKYKA